MYNFEFNVLNKSVQVDRELAMDDVEVAPKKIETANDIYSLNSL